MSISRKHHYLPQFYLKGFTNPNDLFSIYDYKKGHIKNNDHTPSSHFFELDRNTVEYQREKTDLPEQYHGYGETRYSPLLQKIRNGKLPKLDQYEMVTLQEFVLSTFWRIPANDELFLQQLKTNPVLQESFQIFDRVTGKNLDEQKLQEFIDSEAFIKMIKPTAASTFLMANRGNDFSIWGFAYGEKGNRVCSDNPFIFKKYESNDIFETDFIMPLSKNHLLIKTNSKVVPQPPPSEFTFLVDLLIFKQGTIFCCSPVREYLDLIAKTEKNFTVDQLRYNIFKILNGH